MAKSTKFIVLILGMSLGSKLAAATVDRASRSDISDFRSHRARSIYLEPVEPDEVGGVYTEAVPPGEPFDLQDVVVTGMRKVKTFQIALTGAVAYSTNPDQTYPRVGSAIYGTPGLTIDKKASIARNWTIDANMLVDGDYFDDRPHDLNESRLFGQVQLSHAMKAGTLTVSFRTKSSFTAGYGTRNYTQERYVVAFAPTFAKALDLTVELEYRASTTDAQRRSMARILGDKKIFDNGTMSLEFDQSFEFSAFRAGKNDGRRDVLSSSSLAFSPGVRIGRNASLQVVAYLYHDFSNRDANTFTDFEIGPSIKVPLGR